MEPNLSDRFVEQHLASLQAGTTWEPDAGRALQRYRTARRRRNRSLSWAAGITAAALAGLLAFPVTRVFAQRCVDACVAETLAVRQFLGFTAEKAVVARQAAPDIALTDASGNVVRLADFRGKVILLNFWATWCPPCKLEIPWFVEFQKHYGDAGLVVVGVSLDEDGWPAVLPCLEKMPVNYRMTLGNDAVAQAFGGVDRLPSTFLIDRAGRIAVSHTGLADRAAMEERLRTILAEQ